MGSIPLKELRRSLGRVMRSRKPVIVTRRGKPVAKIVPIRKALSTAEAFALIDRTSGIIDDPSFPTDASVRLNDYLYGPIHSRRQLRTGGLFRPPRPVSSPRRSRIS